MTKHINVILSVKVKIFYNTMSLQAFVQKFALIGHDDYDLHSRVENCNIPRILERQRLYFSLVMVSMTYNIVFAVVVNEFANWRKVLANCHPGCGRRTTKEWYVNIHLFKTTYSETRLVTSMWLSLVYFGKAFHC